MKTSEEIYNRIMTDPQLNKNLFVIVYKDVVKKKYIEVPAVKWLPMSKGGDVPYHRVDFIKYDGKVIWDRMEKICIIDQCICNAEDEILPSLLKITTFNVLSDEYEKSITNINKRISNILDYISTHDDDIICLQEVQPVLLAEIKKMFDVTSESTDTKKRYIAHTTMGFNDVVIMTKIKHLYSEQIDLGQQKSAILVNLKLEGETELHIIGVHLTSDYYDDNSKKRVGQLFKIRQKLNSLENSNPGISSQTILLGDTNEMIYEHSLVHFTDYSDTWMDLKPGEKCYTYDPSTNVLAKKLSNNKNPVRLDRILYTKNSIINCVDVQLDRTITFSDHYPLTANFIISECDIIIQTEKPDLNKTTNQTALAIILPYELWQQINSLKISGATDVQEGRWMPHLNLFFGFTPPEYFYEISKNIAKLKLQSFDVEFNKLDFFRHERTFTLFLKPDDESIERLSTLHRQLSSSEILKLSCFDAKTVYSPHITLGNTEDESKIMNAIRQQINIKFTVNTISFVSRIGFEYFKVMRNVVLSQISMSDHIEFVREIARAYNVDCHICGSRIYEIESESNQSSQSNQSNQSNQSKTADADLLCIGHDKNAPDRSTFFNKITRIFETCGRFRKVQIVKNKYVYCLKLKTNDSNIDIQYVKMDDTTDNYYKSGMAIMTEPQFIITQMGSKLNLFKECLIWTKNKLKEKKLYGAIYCYMGGMSVAILVATIIKQCNITSLGQFISALKSFDYDKPIHLGHNNNFKQENPCDRLFYIGTSTVPIENTMRHVCKSTAKLLKDQFRAGFEDISSSQTYARTLTFTIDATNDDALEDCMTWFNGIVTAMIVAIERNSKDIVLKPATEWVIEELENGQLSASWTLQSSENYSSLDYTGDRLVQKSTQLFTEAFVSYK